LIGENHLDRHGIPLSLGLEPDLVEDALARSVSHAGDPNLVDPGPSIDMKESGASTDINDPRTSSVEDRVARRGVVPRLCAGLARNQDGENNECSRPFRSGAGHVASHLWLLPVV